MILATVLLGQAYISIAEEILWLLDAKSLLACSAVRSDFLTPTAPH